MGIGELEDRGSSPVAEYIRIPHNYSSACVQAQLAWLSDRQGAC